MAFLHVLVAVLTGAFRYTAALIAEIVFGYRISSLNDEYVLLAENASTQTIMSGSPGSSVLSLLVDFFPIRK